MAIIDDFVFMDILYEHMKLKSNLYHIYDHRVTIINIHKTEVKFDADLREICNKVKLY